MYSGSVLFQLLYTMLSHSTWETLRPTAKSVEFGVFSRRVISGGYLCGLRIILSY
jgi:hypothetical protein